MHHRNDDAQTNRKDKPYLAGYLEPFRGKPNTVVHTHGKNTRLKDGASRFRGRFENGGQIVKDVALLASSSIFVVNNLGEDLRLHGDVLRSW